MFPLPNPHSKNVQILIHGTVNLFMAEGTLLMTLLSLLSLLKGVLREFIKLIKVKFIEIGRLSFIIQMGPI